MKQTIFVPKGSKYEQLEEKKWAKNPGKRIARGYSRSLTIVMREIDHLKTLSIGGKLDSGHARDLATYVKLLAEMKKIHFEMQMESEENERKKLAALSDEELEREVKQLLKAKGKTK